LKNVHIVFTLSDASDRIQISFKLMFEVIYILKCYVQDFVESVLHENGFRLLRTSTVLSASPSVDVYFHALYSFISFPQWLSNISWHNAINGKFIMQNVAELLYTLCYRFW